MRRGSNAWRLDPIAARRWMQRHVAGGAKGIRTPDLLNAIQTRYQLRHNPTKYPNIIAYSARLGKRLRIKTQKIIGQVPESARKRNNGRLNPFDERIQKRQERAFFVLRERGNNPRDIPFAGGRSRNVLDRSNVAIPP